MTGGNIRDSPCCFHCLFRRVSSERHKDNLEGQLSIMNQKNTSQTINDLRKTHYNNLRQQQCALNMQIRLAMQTHDLDMKVRLESKLNEIIEQIKYLGG